MAVQFRFSQFDGRKCFFPQIQQAPGPDFRKVGKSLQSLEIPLVIVMEVPVYIGLLDLLHFYSRRNLTSVVYVEIHLPIRRVYGNIRNPNTPMD